MRSLLALAALFVLCACSPPPAATLSPAVASGPYACDVFCDGNFIRAEVSTCVPGVEGCGSCMACANLLAMVAGRDVCAAEDGRVFVEPVVCP